MAGLNKYQLQEELKKALYNRKQNNGKFLFYEDFLTIEYDEQADVVYSNWKGYQTEKSVQEGYQKLQDALWTLHCSKILSDTTNMLGVWPSANSWVEGPWLTGMKQAGLRYFAWVYSNGAIPKESTDGSEINTNVSDIVQTFDDIQIARKWLNRSSL